MQPSIFNLRVPLAARDEVFLMNTLTDAQLVVSSDVAALLDRTAQRATSTPRRRTTEEREALEVLRENGFLVESREADRRDARRLLHARSRTTRTELNVTVLTTLQCNFACDYCFQGDHGDYNKFADKMSMETAGQVGDWIERELDRVHPEKLVLTFFGGEPLLNLPVMYYLAERMWQATQVARPADVVVIITNGLLLTAEVVDRLLPYGLTGVKITLDGDRDTHNRMRPLRGGQGTFDRIIENIRQVAGKMQHRDRRQLRRELGRQLSGAARLPAASRTSPTSSSRSTSSRSSATRSGGEAEGHVLPLIPVGADNKPLNGTCMTNVGKGGGVGLRFVQLPRRQDDVSPRGDQAPRAFRRPTACTTAPATSTTRTRTRSAPMARSTRARGSPAKRPVDRSHRRPARRSGARPRGSNSTDCTRGTNAGTARSSRCVPGDASWHRTHQLGDMNMPTCHKPSFESALISLAHERPAPIGDYNEDSSRQEGHRQRETPGLLPVRSSTTASRTRGRLLQSRHEKSQRGALVSVSAAAVCFFLLVTTARCTRAGPIDQSAQRRHASDRLSRRRAPQMR